MNSRGRLDLIERILDIELEMFLGVPAEGESPCREHPKSFRLHRKSQFAPWSDDTLKSYLHDLLQAVAQGRNLMTVKYALMGNVIPRQNHNPLIDEIIGIQLDWQQDMFMRFPCIMSGGRPLSSRDDTEFRTSFETYLRGELETYSDTTLSLLRRDIADRVKCGGNMAEEIYFFLIREMGYGSMDEAEQSARVSMKGKERI